MDLTLPLDFKDFLRSLDAKGVEYLLVGGYAVGYHGYPRATQDLDIWVSVHPDNAGRMVTVLREFGFDVPDLSPDLFLKTPSIVRLGIPPMRIEVTTWISGVDFEPCYAERIRDRIDGVEIDIISLRHLKQNKKASGRFKDLDDLENLP